MPQINSGSNIDYLAEQNAIFLKLREKWDIQDQTNLEINNTFRDALNKLNQEDVELGTKNTAILAKTRDQERFKQLEEERVKRRKEEFSKIMNEKLLNNKTN